MALFESYERRIDKINGVLAQYGIGSVEECRELCKAKGFDPYEIVKGIQPICFENACWAYTVGAAIALKSGVTTAAEAAKKIGEGLQSFCIDGSVAEDRKVGLGHGNLGAMLLSEESKCFAFLAGHESFAAAEGAIGIVRNANKARKTPLRVILNGLGKDAAQIISRINGFTYVQTKFDYYTGELKIVNEIRYSEGERADVRCYGADDVREGVAIMHHEGVDVSITGNSTNPTRFQHPVAGTYKKECIEQGKKYFSVASGGGTGRTLHPDNMAAGPASYGMTDTMGRILPAAIDAAGIDVVFSGHDHAYARTELLTGGEVAEKGTTYVICGDMGEKSRDVNYAAVNDPAFHFAKISQSYQALYLLVNTTRSELTVTAYDLNGSVVDTFTVEHDNACRDGHSFVFDRLHKTLICSVCGETAPANYTGWATDKTSGKQMYFLAGEYKTGWMLIGTAAYHFDLKNGTMHKTTILEDVPTTCSVQGHLSVKCECGETYETKYDKPSGHSFSKVVADDGTVPIKT